MKISASQKKALEAQGYTVGKNGTSVLKNGQSIGGINENGKFWAGSQKVMSILKGGDKPAVKTQPKVVSAKRPAAKKTAVAKDPMKGYRKVDVTSSKIPADKTNKMRGQARTTASIRKTAERALAKATTPKKDQPKDWLQRKLNSSGVVYGVTKTR